MMGTLASVLAGSKIRTSEKVYHATVKGDIENVDGVLKITRIHVNYFLKLEKDKQKAAEDALDTYLPLCPAAQSVIGCIDISHELSMDLT